MLQHVPNPILINKALYQNPYRNPFKEPGALYSIELTKTLVNRVSSPMSAREAEPEP